MLLACRFHNVLTDGEADYLVQLVSCTISISHLFAAAISAVQPHLFATRVEKVRCCKCVAAKPKPHHMPHRRNHTWRSQRLWTMKLGRASLASKSSQLSSMALEHDKKRQIFKLLVSVMRYTSLVMSAFNPHNLVHHKDSETCAVDAECGQAQGCS